VPILSELTVILKDSERTYRQKFLIYDAYCPAYDDPIIIQCIQKAKKNFDGEPDDINIKIHLEIQ
jgi:hypothetical protein